MDGVLLALILDFALLAILGVAIFYMVRVMSALSAFKTHRKEFMHLMNELSRNIDKAQATIESMKQTSVTEGDNLQELIDQARLASDDLRLINETSESLGNRLEGLAERNSRQSPARKAKEFAIQDKEFGASEPKTEADPKPDYAPHDWGAKKQGRSPEPENDLKTKAERELYEALQRGGRG